MAAREYAKIKRAVVTADTTELNSYEGITPALKRAIAMEPMAEGRILGVMIDGDSIWHSQRLWRGHSGG